MSLPFTAQQFFGVFAAYNEAVWPAPVVLNLLAAIAVALAAARRADAAVAAILAVLWAWSGAVYHGIYFREINPPAWLFAALFGAGALVLAVDGLRGRLRFAFAGTPRHALGAALIVYALLVYPLLAGLFGHGYPAAPTFGVPCPTTTFTLGMLALLREPYPRRVLAVPVLWALAASPAAIALGVLEDAGMFAAGLLGLWMMLAPRGERRIA